MNKMKKLLQIRELIRTGHAAVNKSGRIVDRRTHPDAVPILAHGTGSSVQPGTGRSG